MDAELRARAAWGAPVGQGRPQGAQDGPIGDEGEEDWALLPPPRNVFDADGPDDPVADFLLEELGAGGQHISAICNFCTEHIYPPV